MGTIVKKRYYKIMFHLESPLAIGCGNENVTDSDITKNSKGEPYIPATALAGVYREIFRKEMQEEYFGYVVIDGIDEEKEEKSKESKILVYDANLNEKDNKYVLSKRDCVALDEWKVAKQGAKFDFEILESGAHFVTYIEQNKENKDKNICDFIIEKLFQGFLLLGSKVSRGYGKIRADKVEVLEFSFEDETSIKKWLDFSMFYEESWENAGIKKECWKNWQEIAFCSGIEQERTKYLNEKKEETVLRINLKQMGGISIRRYSTQLGENAPDFEQITARIEDGKEIPVIPGTSWAGAFRTRIIELAKSIEIDEKKIEENIVKKYFGYVEKKDRKKSNVIFSESKIEGANPKVITRNAIDRFSGGAVDQALFTEKSYFGGHTELTIIIKEKITDEMKKLLVAALMDLHYGFLAIGGLTSIGRGLFEITSIQINEKKEYTVDKKEELEYEELLKML